METDERDLLGFSPTIVQVIRDGLETAGNPSLERAMRKLSYMLVLAKLLCSDERFDELFEREVKRAVPDLHVSGTVAEMVLAALDLDAANSVPDPELRDVIVQRRARIVKAVSDGR